MKKRRRSLGRKPRDKSPKPEPRNPFLEAVSGSGKTSSRQEDETEFDLFLWTKLDNRFVTR